MYKKTIGQGALMGEEQRARGEGVGYSSIYLIEEPVRVISLLIRHELIKNNNDRAKIKIIEIIVLLHKKICGPRLITKENFYRNLVL